MVTARKSILDRRLWRGGGILRRIYPLQPRIESILGSVLVKVVGLTGFVIIHAFIASFSPAQVERKQIVNTKFTRPVNELPMSTVERVVCDSQHFVHQASSIH